MTRFGQWWKRTVRCGWAYAQGRMHGRRTDRHVRPRTAAGGALGRRCCRLTVVALAWPTGGWSLLGPVALPAVGGPVLPHPPAAAAWPPGDAAAYTVAGTLAKFPQLVGIVKYALHRGPVRLIEYKGPRTATVAYLTTYYPHVSHSFIRREIAAAGGARRRRRTVQHPPARPAWSTRPTWPKRGRTTVLLAGGGWRCWPRRRPSRSSPGPLRFGRALRLAVCAWAGGRTAASPGTWSTSPRRACCGGWLRARGVDPPARPLRHQLRRPSPCSPRTLGGPPYSFTVHGPRSSTARPAESLGGQDRRVAAFVVAVSSFGRSQLYRWADRWRIGAEIHVVHCGLDCRPSSAADPRPGAGRAAAGVRRPAVGAEGPAAPARGAGAAGGGGRGVRGGPGRRRADAAGDRERNRPARA